MQLVKRFFCIFLSFVILTSVFVVDYKKVNASPYVLPVSDGLIYLFELALAAMGGYAAYNAVDYVTGAEESLDYMELYDLDEESDASLESLKNANAGDTISVTASLWEKMCNYVTDVFTPKAVKMNGNSALARTPVASFTEAINIVCPGSNVDYGSYENSLNRNWLNNLQKYGFVGGLRTDVSIHKVYLMLYVARGGDAASDYSYCYDANNVIRSYYKSDFTLENGQNFYGIQFVYDEASNTFSYLGAAVCRSTVEVESVLSGLRVPLYSSPVAMAFESSSTLASSTVVGKGASILFDLPESFTIPDVNAIPNTISGTVAELDTDDTAEIDAAVNAKIIELLGDIAAGQEVENENGAAQEETSLGFLGSILDAIRALPGLISGAFTWLRDGIASIISSIGTLAGDIADAFPDVIGLTDEAMDWIMDLPLESNLILNGLSELLDDIVGNVGVLADNVIVIPGTIADILEGLISIPQDIVDEIVNALSIDMTVTSAAVAALTDVWVLKFPFLPVIVNTFQSFTFSDTYDYPVIRVQTPSIIRGFYQHDYIIVFDGEDYAAYFVMVRNLVRAFIWFKFAYYLFKHFKVNFHIG